jgi:hypothetical protein
MGTTGPVLLGSRRFLGDDDAVARRLCDEVRSGHLVGENDYPQRFRDLLTVKGLLVEGDGGMALRLRRLRFRWHE